MHPHNPTILKNLFLTNINNYQQKKNYAKKKNSNFFSLGVGLGGVRVQHKNMVKMASSCTPQPNTLCKKIWKQNLGGLKFIFPKIIYICQKHFLGECPVVGVHL